jgi:DNA-directed RNA polymerase specialized sigma24 family protein
MTTNNNEEPYFGKSVDDAIIEFCASNDNKKKSVLFEKKIYPAFRKLSQYHYNKIPVIKNPQVVDECVVFLYEQLYKFNPDKQSRGFPYFNIIAKHYFIQKIKQEKRESLHDETRLVSLSDTSHENMLVEDLESNIEEKQFIEIFKQNLPLWKDKFNKPQEKQIVDCLISLFSNPQEVSIYKKKAILILLKEMTGMNTKQITINLNKIKKKFYYLKSKYQRGDI